MQIRRRGAPELWFPRRSGASVDVVLEPKKPKWAFKHADRRNAKAAVMLAPSEWAEGRLVAKDLKTGDQADAYSTGLVLSAGGRAALAVSRGAGKCVLATPSPKGT